MAEVRITNCHAHLFTQAHVPRDYPSRLAARLIRVPGLANTAADVLGWLGREELSHTLQRLAAMGDIGALPSQREVLLRLVRQYPPDTRHVILPMDLGPTGYGPVKASLREQHDELATLARDPVLGPRVIPFATIHPKADGAWEELRRAVEVLGFKGLKLYPKLGYEPTDPLLMENVFPLCEERGLPVVSHCSRGGVRHKGWSAAECDRVSSPDAWLPVLDAFPRLRVNLAHLGGGPDWEAYLEEGLDPDDPGARATNWVTRIADLIKEGRENLWTDVSYTIFRVGEYGALLNLLLDDPRIARRVLFGSDFYLSRQEALSEKAMSIRLRAAVGERHWARIAEANPAVWLGEAVEKEPMPTPRGRP